ncbi:MAG: RNA polymerase sigma factor [Acidobacteriota bacterium]
MHLTANDPDDGALLRGVVSGSAPAFEELVRRRKGYVMGLCHTILRQREDAEDAVQLVFLKVYERAVKLRQETSFDAWLRRLTVSTCLDILRRRKVRAFLCPWENLDGVVDGGAASTEDGALYGSLRGRVEAILRKLPARQRAVFTLRVFEEWTLQEIADSLSVEVGTVKTQLFRSIHRVRAELSEDGARLLSPKLATEARPS